MALRTSSILAGLALLGPLLAAPVADAVAQATPGTTTGTGAQTRGGERPTAPVPGANSFTEGQARDRLQDTGFSNVTDLRKDDQGIWRGRATRGGGSQADVALDYQGNIFAGGTLVDASAGTGGATPANNPGTGTGTTTGAASGANRADGTPGNPPSTAVGRAADAVTGTPTRPDGTPGNPPGTAAGRAMDRALGTNTTGTNPSGSATAPTR